jgi:hypothetical protein
LLTERFDEAFRYAHQLHRAQTRKGTPIPYISHLMAVAALVVEHGGTEDRRSRPCCMMPQKIRAAQKDWTKSERNSAAPLPPSFPTARTPGRNRNRSGARARKPTSRSCLANRHSHCWSRSPTRRTTRKPSCLTIASWAIGFGRASMAARAGPVGTTAPSPKCFQRLCPAGWRIGFRGALPVFRPETWQHKPVGII